MGRCPAKSGVGPGLVGGLTAATSLGTVLGVRPAIWIIMTGLALSGLILLIGPLRRHRNLPVRR